MDNLFGDYRGREHWCQHGAHRADRGEPHDALRDQGRVSTGFAGMPSPNPHYVALARQYGLTKVAYPILEAFGLIGVRPSYGWLLVKRGRLPTS